MLELINQPNASQNIWQKTTFDPAEFIDSKSSKASSLQENNSLESAKSNALSISEINERAKQLLERQFAGIYIEGEVSKMSAAGSYKHWYFTLKDASSKIDCAFFNPPASLRQPKVGEKIILCGRLSLYAKEARYQFIANRLFSTDEQGAMHEIFLRLYEKLKAQGVFNRHLPLAPSFKSVGIITSASSAAMADILRIRQNLGDLCTHISVYDSLVQGDLAPKQLLNALTRADAAGHDVLLIARGGGSKEDLFCFNDEALALAISQTKTPIITAIGHEVDQHLADFAADLSLPTPSAAARRIFVDMSARIQEQDMFKERIQAAIMRNLASKRQKLEVFTLRLAKNPFNEYLTKLDSYKQIINKLIKTKLDSRIRLLNSLDLVRIIKRTFNQKQAAFALLKAQVKPSQIRHKIDLAKSKLAAQSDRLQTAQKSAMNAKLSHLKAVQNLLDAQGGFLKTMKKSFVIYDQNSKQIENIEQLASEDVINIYSALDPTRAKRAKIL